MAEQARAGGGTRVPEGPTGYSMDEGLRAVSRVQEVATVIDVGASNGMWTLMARKYFPNARYFLIEAQSGPHEKELRRLKETDPAIDYVIAAAANREGSIHFDASDPFGGVASEHVTGRSDIVVPSITIDGEVARRGLRGPFLVKLDTHGFEAPILEGAAETLRAASVLVIEAYVFTLRPGTLRFHELCAWLEQRGFMCVDVVDLQHRPVDGALWQMDLFFVRSDAPQAVLNSYR